jgi:hypothetical protein
VIRVVVVRLQLDGPLELNLSLVLSMERKKVRGQRGPCFRKIGMQANGFGQKAIRLCLLALGDVNESQQFVDFKTPGGLLHQRLKLFLSSDVLLSFVRSQSGEKSLIRPALYSLAIRFLCALLWSRRIRLPLDNEEQNQYANRGLRSS